MSDEANAASNAASETVQPDIAQTSAPAAAPAAPEPAKSAREAIDRAFDTFEQKTDTAEPAKADRARDESGKFVKNDAKPDAVVQPAVEPQKAQEAAKAFEDAAKQAEQKPAVAAPQGFTKAAQDAWGQTPEPVRADVERRLGELTKGIDQYKAVVEPFKHLADSYGDVLKNNGVSLPEAAARMFEVNRMLDKDAPGAIKQIMQAYGVTVEQLTGAPPDPNAATPQIDVSKFIDPLNQKVGGLEQTLKSFIEQQEMVKVEQTINAFRDAHPYFEELRPSIAKMMATGFSESLEDAYQNAVRLNPEIAAKIEADNAAKAATAKQPDPAQTRQKASLSVTGTPSVGSNPSSRKPAGSPREALDNAFASIGL